MDACHRVMRSKNMRMRGSLHLVIGSICLVFAGCQVPPGGSQSTASTPHAGGGGDIAGVVTSVGGPEAGVWVIAETNDLPTKFTKIVVTDDRGRYLIPELPKANYRSEEHTSELQSHH